MVGLTSTAGEIVVWSGGRAHRYWSLAIVWGAVLTGGVASLIGADLPQPATATNKAVTCLTGANQAVHKNLLTNQGVVTLARAGYSEGFIIDTIYQKQTQFDVSAEGLACLANEGLSERVIRTIVANERKDEKTAMVPATVQYVAEPTARSSPNGYQLQRTEVQVPLPVVFPAPAPMPWSWHSTLWPWQSSWYVKGYMPDRWYITPNVPALPSSSR